MRLGFCSLALVALMVPAAWAGQPITPQPMVVPVAGPHAAYATDSVVPGASCVGCGHGHHYSACGPQAYNAFAACGCSACGTHAGGYGCCPKPACDGSIWTSTYHPRSRNLHLWDTYCADTTPCPYTGHDMNGLFHNAFGPCHKWAHRGCRHGHCQLHSYHRQPHLAMPVGYAHGGGYANPASVPHMMPEAPAVPHQEALPEGAPIAPPSQPADSAPAEPQAPEAEQAAPLLSPDAIELAPATLGPAGLDQPPAPAEDNAVEAPAPRL